MGNYEDVAFTIRPAETPLDEGAAACRGLLDAPLDELPAGDWDPGTDRYRERDFDRQALTVEVDETRGQVYFGGRTLKSGIGDAWRAWVVNGGIGDGLLVEVLGHEVEYEGFGRFDDDRFVTDNYLRNNEHPRDADRD